MASPELATIVQTMRSRPPTADLSIEEQRAGMETFTSLFPVADDVRSEPVDANGVPAEWISTPAAEDQRVILYLHGGGYVIGSIATHRDMVSRLGRAAAARALSVDYRLAPEHPFPAAVDDATDAYRWLLSTGVDPARLVIAGDSAGGGLTVATLVALRDAGDPLPAAAVCVSPWADLECRGESITSKADLDPILRQESILKWGKLYLGDADPRTPLASPIHADLAGLPPLLIMMGTAELLFDDATRLAERAQAGGVDVTLEPWEEMIHAWPIFAALLPEGQQALDRMGNFIRERTA
jgi:acetyl esterase/lipase